MRNLPTWARALLIVIAGGAAGAIIAVAIGRDATPTATSTVTVKARPAIPAGTALVTAVDGPDADTKRDDPLALSPAAVDELQAATTATDRPGDTHSELADPLREPGDGPVVLNEGPLAAQELDGCRTRFVRNSSSRGGQTPRVIVWHQTVSHDNGQASQDGLTAMANRASSGVSWHALIGSRSGLCTYTVPLNLKAWTQGNANRFSIGIEVEAYGDEPSYVTGKGRAKLLSVTRAMAKRYGIPLQRAVVRNCVVIKGGIAEHHDLGLCGGGHLDVSSTRWQRNPSGGELAGWDIDPLIAALKGKACDRACDVRKRNVATHAELKRRRCAASATTRSERCKLLHRRHAALHAAARREGIKL